MFSRTLLLGMTAVLALGAQAEAPSEFYVVSHSDADVSNGWDYRILDVRQESMDSVIRYILVAPVRACPRGVTVRAAEARLLGVSPAQLVSDENPCEVSRADHSSRRSSGPSLLGSIVRFGFVAKCGPEERTVELAHPEEVSRRIVDRAFGSREVFWGVTEDEDLEPQRAGDTLVPELVSGRYDRGLDALQDSGKQGQIAFRALLTGYAGLVRGSKAVMPRLLAADRYRFVKYIEPDMPRLGVAALLEGTVHLQLDVDTSSGVVWKVEILDGQPELAERASRAAENWRFEPGSLGSGPITVGLDFRFRCP